MFVPRILIVDDSPLIQKLLAKKLKDYGAEVTLALDGKEALKIALKNEFDLIITDVDMPRLNGINLCQQLKRNPITRGIPIIIISSHEGDMDIGLGFQAGAIAYIPKSNVEKELYKTLDDVLGKARFQRSRLILIVDDSKTTLKVVGDGLAQAGFKVITAQNGKEALDFMQYQYPDLILSDIGMPVMDGMTLYEKVQTDPDTASIPFVIMSSNNERAIMRRMLQRGVSSYLVKPFNLEQLIITVEKLLSDQYLFLLKDRERLEVERNSMLASITSLIQALEARDAYTRGHSETVASIVTGMANKINEEPDEIEKIRIGARLHDLGKIGVPDAILLKEGRLTDEEYEIVKRHPTIGAGILSPIPSLTEIIPIILHHHERFDGEGYPDGLKNEKIPFWARITAVADIYHALTSDRPYRRGMEIEKALEIIRDASGTQLCPECVDLFFDWLSTEPDIEQEQGTTFYSINDKLIA
ncbi:MAG: response regulator [Thermodesulfobacteriota bacterium]|nr:response regulator [Thermodesulfobacteriota bacterium]